MPTTRIRTAATPRASDRHPDSGLLPFLTRPDHYLRTGWPDAEFHDRIIRLASEALDRMDHICDPTSGHEMSGNTETVYALAGAEGSETQGVIHALRSLETNTVSLALVTDVIVRIGLSSPMKSDLSHLCPAPDADKDPDAAILTTRRLSTVLRTHLANLLQAPGQRPGEASAADVATLISGQMNEPTDLRSGPVRISLKTPWSKALSHHPNDELREIDPVDGNPDLHIPTHVDAVLERSDKIVSLILSPASMRIRPGEPTATQTMTAAARIAAASTT